MARTIQKTILSFVSTAVFFATFIVSGDVLVAALVAVATALVQVVVRLSTQHRTGALMWASLALVIALTGLTIKGDTTFDGPMSEAQLRGPASAQTPASLAKCGCRVRDSLTEARLTTASAL